MPKKEIALSERHDSARDNGGESKDASEKRAGSGSPTLLNVDAVLNEMRRKTAEKYGNEWTIDPLKSRPAQQLTTSLRINFCHYKNAT